MATNGVYLTSSGLYDSQTVDVYGSLASTAATVAPVATHTTTTQAATNTSSTQAASNTTAAPAATITSVTYSAAT